MQTKKLHIPHQKGTLFVLFLVLIPLTYLTSIRYQSELAGKSDPWFLLVLDIILILTHLTDYILTQDGIQCRYLFIPFRKVKWEKISDAVLLSEWNDLGATRKETVLMVSLKPSLPYAEHLFSVVSHRARNPMRTLFMYVPKNLEYPLAQMLGSCLSDEQFRDRRKTKNS